MSIPKKLSVKKQVKLIFSGGFLGSGQDHRPGRACQTFNWKRNAGGIHHQ